MGPGRGNIRPERPSLIAALAAIVIGAVLLLLGCDPGGGEARPMPGETVSYPVSAQTLNRGRILYLRHCAPCHGVEGHGDGAAAAVLHPKPRDHSDRRFMDGLSDQHIAEVVRNGIVPSGSANMPGNPQIRGDDMVAVVAYLRTLSRDVSEVLVVKLLPASGPRPRDSR